MMHAKVSTIRDRQLEERKGMEQMYLNKEKRLDTMMELERLKEIQFQEMKEKEIKRVADLYKDKIPQKLYEAMYNYEVEITD